MFLRHAHDKVASLRSLTDAFMKFVRVSIV